MTLRARLTFLYTAVLAAVLILFGAIVYLSLTFSLTSEIEQTLNRTADDILRASRMPEDLAITLRALDLTTNVFVQVWGEDGVLVWQSANSPELEGPFDTSTFQVVENMFTVRSTEELRLRVLTVPLITRPAEHIVGYLQLAGSLETVDLVIRMLVLVLVGGGLFALAVAGVIGYLVARAALRPIDQVTETALQITQADDLSRRIPWLGPPRGEVGRLIQAFNQTLERLEGLFRTQRRFLADVSHELRTPLTAIRGNVDLIGRIGEADPDALEAITSEVDRMTRMVTDLLLLAKAETGKLPMAREEVELDTLLLEVYQQAKTLAQDRVEVRIGQEDQARVRGDRDRLKQVLLNLVTNALDHTPEGGKVTLGLSRQEDWARLMVEDTGPGIPAEELPYIFERFYRLDRSRRRTASGGTGLGLSIAYWITRSHEGRIEVETEVGKGTTFTVWLPRFEMKKEESMIKETSLPQWTP